MGETFLQVCLKIAYSEGRFMKKSRILLIAVGLLLCLIWMVPEVILAKNHVLISGAFVLLNLLVLLLIGQRILKDSKQSLMLKGVSIVWLAIGLVLTIMAIFSLFHPSTILQWLGGYILVSVVLTLIMTVFEKVE